MYNSMVPILKHFEALNRCVFMTRAMAHMKGTITNSLKVALFISTFIIPCAL